MSVAEILAELPKLDPAELQLILKQAVELQKSGTWEPSPELARAIEEAMAVPEEDCVEIDEAFRRVPSVEFKVILTPQALADLREILDYVAKDNPAAAQKLHAELHREAWSSISFLFAERGYGVRPLFDL